MDVKNFFIRIFLKLYGFLSSSQCPVDGHEKFLIVSTTGLGDTLWATPALRALRKSCPRAYIAILTSPIGEQVLRHSPYIDELFIFRSRWQSLLSLLSTLKKRTITTVLVFHASQRIALPLCQLIRAREIIGSSSMNKGLDFILTKALPLRRQHEILRRLEIVSTIPNIPPLDDTSVAMEIFLQKEDHEEATFAIAFPNKPIVALHPGAKDRFKQWHPEGFIAVGRKLATEQGYQIVVTGTKEESSLVDAIASQIPGAVALAGKLSLRGTAALIQKTQLMIANDTGPMHVSLAVGTPTLALFSPTDPALCGPLLSTHSAVIAKTPTCTPCLRKKCNAPFCLLQISTDEVYQKALHLLKTT